MKRTVLLAECVAVCALACALVTGCVSLNVKKPAPPAPPAVGTPEVGQAGLADFDPLVATDFSDGLGVLGFDLRDPKKISLAIRRPADSKNWNQSPIGTGALVPAAATNIGQVQVVVGSLPIAGPPGSPEKPFVAVSTPESGGEFVVTDVSQSLMGGRSTQVTSLARTGGADASDAQFIMVGATSASQNGEVGNPTNTLPFAFTSSDGRSWQRAGELPLPGGTTGADAMAVTFAPGGTAYPGVVAVGTAWTDEPKRRVIGVVWHSADQGKTWKVVSGEDFDQPDRSFLVQFVAADATTIVAAGAGVTAGENSVAGQYGAIDWTISSDGTVDRQIDTLDSNRNSVTTALIARPNGGFLTATQMFDLGSSQTRPGTTPQGNPKAYAWSATTGSDWINQTSSLGMDNAIVIPGIGENGGRVAFYGLNQTEAPLAYIVDSSAVK